MLDKLKPKDGHLAEFHRLQEELRTLDRQEGLPEEEYRKKAKALNAQLDEISISPFAVMGCPRIGIDKEATEWFRDNVVAERKKEVAEEKAKPRAPKDTPPREQWGYRNEAFVKHWSRSFKALVEENKGKYVTELAKKREGVSTVSGMLCSSIDFRGKLVGYAQDVIGDDLAEEAYRDHDADECLDYASRMEAAIDQWVHENPEKAASKTREEDYPEYLRLLRSAVTWLRFWGNEGFGYHAWY